MSEFKLSEKMFNLRRTDMLMVDDVKEFIGLLKEKLNTFEGHRHNDSYVIGLGRVKKLIDKLAGDL